MVRSHSARRRPGLAPPGIPFLYGPLARFLVLAAVGLVPLVLGYIGLQEYLSRPPQSATYGHAWPDILFYDLQLPILAAAPVMGPGPFPVPLGIARLLAPAAAGLATVGTLRLLLAEQWRRWSAAASRHHSVVAGNGPVALELARRLAGEGRRVVLVSKADETLAQGRLSGLLEVRGDPADPGTLRAAGIARSAELFACTAEGAANTGIVLRARDEIGGRRRPLSAYALVRDVELGVALRARRIGTPCDPRLRLDFFDVDEMAARKLLDIHPLNGGRGTPTVILSGLGSLGHAVLREIASRHSLLPGRGPVEVVIRHATEAEIMAATKVPAIAASCSLRPSEAAPSAGSCVAFVCLDRVDEGLREGLAIAHALAEVPARVVVCTRSSSLAGILGVHDGLIDAIVGRLSVFEVNRETCVPADIRADSIEQLARAIHGAYIAMEVAKGNSEASNPSIVSWERLPESLRQANIAQAADIGTKMAAIDAVVVPDSGFLPEFTFTEREVELLSRMEHDRWMRERSADGWTYGEQRDNDRKLHPDLRAWAYLSDEAKDKDRNAIRTLPAIIRAAGFQILRPPAGT